MLSPATRASCLLTRRSSVLVVHEQMKTDTFVVEMGKRELPCASVHAHAVQYPKNNHAHVRSAVLRLAETRNAVCVRRMCGGQDEDPTSTACRRMPARHVPSRAVGLFLFLVYRPTSLDSGDSVSQRTGSGVRAHRHRARDSARSARGLAPPASPTQHPPTHTTHSQSTH